MVAFIQYDVYSEEQVDYIGFADVTQFQQERTRLTMPRIMFGKYLYMLYISKLKMQHIYLVKR